MAVPAVRVLCVDDHNLVRECVVAVIEQEPGLRVAAAAGTIEDAIECFADARPHVTLIGLRARGLDSVAAIRAIRGIDPAARIVVYARADNEAVFFALEAGATGFVLESAAPEDLVRVVTEVHRRHRAPMDDVRSRLESRGGLPVLTVREVEILELMAHGHRTPAISATLGISGHTVKAHLKRVYSKLDVHGRAEALAEALRRGLVRDRSPRRSSSWESRPPIVPAEAREQTYV
jgi:DNA-binding NarL/FixJ family response regulator